MKITLENISKNYNNKIIFKNFSQEFIDNFYVITGSNGSGKTTLLKIILGYISPSDGKVTYYKGKSILENYIGFFSFAAPYQELIEELTLKESINFHFKFLDTINNLSKKDILKKIKLEEYSDIKIHNFSSGMKQRLKLGLALYSDCKFTLIDEPCTNLDENSIDWYHKTINEVTKFKKIIIATNNKDDFKKNEVNIIQLDQIKKNY